MRTLTMLLALAVIGCAGRDGSTGDTPPPHDFHTAYCEDVALRCMDDRTGEDVVDPSFACVSVYGHVAPDGNPTCASGMLSCRAFSTPRAELDVVCCPSGGDCFRP